MDYKYASIEENRRRSPWPWRVAAIGAVLMAAILIAVLSSLATIHLMTPVEHDSPKQFSCGETLDEAHQRGCTFDALTLSWLHPKCSIYGHQQFLEIPKNSSAGTWQYWKDEGGSQEIGNYEAVSMLPPRSRYWTTQEQHLDHCKWMLARIHDAATTPGKRLDTKTASHEHTMHCLEVLVEAAKVGVGEKLSSVIVHGETVDIGWPAC